MGAGEEVVTVEGVGSGGTVMAEVDAGWECGEG